MIGPDPFVIQGSILGRDGLFIGERHHGVIELDASRWTEPGYAQAKTWLLWRC